MKTLKNLRIAVVMGGLSSERKVSLSTGGSIYKELKKHGHKVTAIDINSRSIAKIVKAKPDVVINALHGTYGEDGAMQGILEFLGIPYTGSGVMACGVALNKAKTKEVLANYGVKMAKGAVITKKEEIKNLKLGYPMVFKPIAEGSAVGVYIVKNYREALRDFPKALKFCGRVLAEQFIKGTEISVPVLGRVVLPIIEIVPANEFYDYDAKYTPGKSEHIIPARISKKAYRDAASQAIIAHEALECRDLSRVDFIVKGDKAYFLEINTLPGMTPVSLFPDSARAAGISFYNLIMILIKNALKRHPISNIQNSR
jgi:D-alanine-D-alanine ligase